MSECWSSRSAGDELDAVEQVRDALVASRASAPHDADDLVALREQELGEVRAVLAGDPGDERGAAWSAPAASGDALACSCYRFACAFRVRARVQEEHAWLECATVCGKGPITGHNVSHANNKTKRRWYPNLQTVRIAGRRCASRMRVCTQCIRVTGSPRRPDVGADDAS